MNLTPEVPIRYVFGRSVSVTVVVWRSFVTEIDDVDRVAGLLLTQDPDEVFGGAHGLSVERGDHIAGFEAGIVRGTVPGDGEDDDTALLAGTKLFLDLARERVGLNAEEGVLPARALG